MARMKTEKAEYARFELRLPRELLHAYRELADYESRTMNAQFLRSLQDWIKEHGAPHERQRTPHRTHVVGAGT